MTIKPNWVQWDAVGFASDSRVQNLPDEWKGYYFLLLNSIAIDGEIEWDEDLLVQRFRGRSTDDRSTTVLIKKLLPLFESRVEDGQTFISHPKMDQARDRFFKFIEQRSLAGKGNRRAKTTGERPTNDRSTTVKRPTDEGRTTDGRGPNGVDLDLSSLNSLKNLEEKNNLENKDLLKPQERDLSEREKEKRREEELGFKWAESLGDGNRANLLAETIEALQRTRRSGKMAHGLINRILFKLSQNEPADVDDACRVFLKKHQGKSEKYLFGIIRSLKKEREGEKT